MSHFRERLPPHGDVDRDEATEMLTNERTNRLMTNQLTNKHDRLQDLLAELN